MVIIFLKPLNTEKVRQLLKDKKIVRTVEKHTCFGGLGSVVVKIMTEKEIALFFHKLCLSEFINCVGSQKELWQFCGIDAESIAKYSRVCDNV